MRRGLYIFARVIGLLITLVLAAALAVQHPRVQSALTEKLLEKIQDRFNGKISFSKLKVLPFNAVLIKDALITDDNAYWDPAHPDWEKADTLFHARTITATLSILGLKDAEGVHVRRLNITDGMMHMVVEPESGYNCNLSKIFDIPTPEPGIHDPGPKLFDIRKVQLKNFRYRMNHYMMPEGYVAGSGVNYGDMDLTMDMRGHDVSLGGNVMSGTCDALSFHEKSGCSASNVTGRAVVGQGKAMIRDVHLVDGWSDLDMEYFSMSYRNGWTYAPYNDNVVMEGVFRPSTLSIRTLIAYMGKFDGNTLSFDISEGHAKGYVTDFKVDGFRFTETTSGVSGLLDASVVGMATGDAPGLKYDIKELSFTPSGLSAFIKGWAPSADPGLEKILPRETFTMKGSGHGSLDKMNLAASVSSSSGKAEVDIQARNLASAERGIEIDGKVESDDLMISRFTGIDQLGALTMQAGLRARIFVDSDIAVNVDSLKVSRLEALGYNYSGISAKGTFTKDRFDGRVVCSDPNLNFMFQGLFNLSKKTNNALYKFYANLGYADLKALNIDTRGGSSKASCQVSANFMRVTRGDVLGDINIRNLYLENDEGPHDIGDISIGSHSNNDINRIQFTSSFADGGYVGTKTVGALLDDIQNLTTRKHLPSLYASGSRTSSPAGYDISLELHDTRDLLSFVLPGAYIADSTSVALNINKGGDLLASVKSSRLALGANYLKGIELSFDNYSGSLNCIATADEISVGGIGFRNSALTAFGQDDSFSMGFHYDGLSGMDNLGEIYLNGEFLRDESDSLVIKARPLSSYILFNDEQWDIGESEITVSKEGVNVDGFTLGCGEQQLRIDGGISRTLADTLKVDLNDFDLAIAGRFLKKDYGISGRTSGTAVLVSPLNSHPGLESRLVCDSLSVGDRNAGSLDIAGTWDEDANAFRLELLNSDGGRNAMKVSGTYDPDSRNVDAVASMDGFGIAAVAPFLSNIFSETGGAVNGEVSLSGPLDTLDVSSRGLAFNDVELTVGFTGVRYVLSGPFHMDNSGLYFDNVTVRDSHNGRGLVTGAMRYDRLKDMELDLGLRMTRLQALDKSKDSGNAISGDLAVSGQAAVTGPFDAIKVDTDLTTDGEGNVFVPIGVSSASASGASELLTFKTRETYEDPYEQMMKKMSVKKKTNGDFTAHATVSITPAVQAVVEMDSTTGNEIAASGSGTVTLDLSTAKDILNLNGSYNIDGGSYRFQLPGVVKKDFIISNGSTLKFAGPLMDTELDIKAIHQLKTSLSTLTADTTSVAARRTVECGISITDRIRNPHLSFDIQVPDLDPTTAAQVQSALNTEDKVQKQFISLLLFNSFLPSDISGVANGSNIVVSNFTEIMSGQLNNILQKLDIPLDFGFNYQQNDTGTDIFDVAFSSQLFNNRVVVNGSVGNRKNSTTTSENGDIVGDIDIEYKIDNQGQFRVKLFSHSADQYSSYLDLSQRNGVGITYQKEYNKFSEFIRNIFSTKEQREQRALEAALAPPEEQTVIKIGNE